MVELEKFQTWLDGCRKIVADNCTRNKYNEFATPTLEVEKGGRRYIRIVSISSASRSAWAFIEIETGNIFKPASWKTPAKHARGNIFDEHNGLKWIGPYGPAYLR